MPDAVEQAIRGARVVVGGLVAGLLTFGAIALATEGALAGRADPDLARILPAILGLLALGCALGYGVLYRLLIRDLRARAADLRLTVDPSAVALDPYRRFAFAGAVLIEGPAFFGLVTFLLTGHRYGLAAGGLGIVLLLAHLPSRQRLRQLAEDAAH